MDKIISTDRVKNGEVLLRVKKSDIIHTIKTGKANWIGQTLSWSCLLKHAIEGREDEEEDVSRYWMNLGKREDRGNWNRKLWTCG
jgi:hypothetical protein